MVVSDLIFIIGFVWHQASLDDRMIVLLVASCSGHGALGHAVAGEALLLDRAFPDPRRCPYSPTGIFFLSVW